MQDDDAIHSSGNGAAIALAPARPYVELNHGPTDITLFRIPSAERSSAMACGLRTNQSPDMLMISRGSGKPAFGKMAGSAFHVPGTMAVRATFSPYGMDSEVMYDPSAQTFGLSFPQNYLRTLVQDMADRTSFNPLLFQMNTPLVELARAIDTEISSPGFASGMLIESLSRAVAINLLRLDLRNLGADADRIHLPRWKLRRVVEFVEANLANDIRLGDLAGIAGLSTFHFARVFKQATGVTPYHFVRDRRIERARMLLLDDNFDLSHVALACGFASQSHFTAAFSKAVGTAPGRYRRRNRS